ncbi:hypothetical protein Tco_1291968 [Tanacetum coccineum]
MIGSLMYLTSSRPDIVQAIYYYARYQARPTKKHLKEDSGFELTAFSDTDHVGCLDTCKSTSGRIQFLGDKLVSWMSKKQDCTVMSTTEAEYVALSISRLSRQRLSSKIVSKFQDDAKYEHVGQDKRPKDSKDHEEKDLKISELNTKSKDNDNGSRSKIT